MRGWRLFLAATGAAMLLGTVEGIIGGTVSTFWGTTAGHMASDFPTGLIAFAAILRWLREV